VRSSDCVARWGGEEFAILAPLSGAEVDVRTWAEGVRRAVSDDPVAAGGELQRVNVSIGVALAAAERARGDALVEAADRALYAAKRRGRDQVCLISELSGSELADDEPESIRVARALSLTASVREGIGEEHADQVASLAVRVARELGLPESVVSLARLVGWLHDVGKVAIPESVLGKPGPLDEDEWLAMRTHPAVGESIVSHVDSLRAAAAGVRHHHERFDGGGYPDGLAGISIPIEARIVAAADAYSAITQDRVYAPARSREEAIAELERSAGTHLDPAVVTALVAVLRPSPTALRLFDAA
jgi:HD-GYP domain-containing protein (c-di-GMP phosphodiesterase class II)